MNKKKRCEVTSCRVIGGRMFSFPLPSSRPEIFSKWLAASGNPDLVNLSEDKIRSRVICAKHFEQRYFLAKKLANTAVPTLFLPDINKKKRCEITSCRVIGGRMFSFPLPSSRPEIFSKWLAASGNPDLVNLSEDKIRRRVICAKHFEQRYFLAKKLANTAVPTLFLPGTTEEMKVEEPRGEQRAMEILQLLEDHQGMASDSAGSSTEYKQQTSLITVLGFSTQKNLEP